MAIGNRDSELGFTLIEMLVVVVIAGLVMASFPALISRWMPGADASRIAKTLADDLRRTRETAIRGNRVVEVSFDGDQGLYELDFGDHVLRKEPASFSYTAPAAKDAVTRFALRFFADGSSTGGAIEVRSAGASRQVVTDWATGSVRYGG